jgi:hypothetical protein
MKNALLTYARRGLLIALAFSWPGLQALAQDAPAKKTESNEEKKKRRIVIVQDENGRTVKADTVVYGDGPVLFNGKEFDVDFDFDRDFDFDFDFSGFDGEHAVVNAWALPDTGFAWRFKSDGTLSEEERQQIKEEMARAREEMQKARDAMRAARREAIRQELDRAREEMKTMDRGALEREMEKLREELLEMKQDLERRHRLRWKDGAGCLDRMNEDGTGPGMKKCMVIMDGDTIVCLGPKTCKMSKAQCLDKARRAERVKVIIEKEERLPAPEAPPEAPAPDESPEAPEAPEEAALQNPEGQAPARATTVNASEEPIALRDLAFYPNPTSGRFHLGFTLDTPGPVNIRLVDFAGKVLLNEEAHGFPGPYSKQFDVSGSARGNYLLMISQGGQWTHERLVVN